MFPAYLSYLLGNETSLTTALLGSLACMSGLIVFFSLLGAVSFGVGTILLHYLPFFGIIAGAAVIIMGMTLIANIELPVFRIPVKLTDKRNIISLFLFGLAYGLASTSCSAPLLFSILFYATASGGFIEGIVAFMIYAMGIGLPIIITSVLVVKAKHLLLGRIASLTPTLRKISGIVVVFFGIYLIYLHISYR